jgi:predicted PurR-regulated permease PerM
MEQGQQVDGISLLIYYKWKIAASLALAIILFFVALIILPLADGIVLGLVFAYIARPIFMKLKGRRRLGSLVATMCIVLPVIFIIGAGLLEIINLVGWVVDNQSQVIGSIFDFIREIDIPESMNDELQQLVWNVSTSFFPLLSQIGLVSYARGIAMFVINLMISIFVCYFLLADGDRLYRSVVEVTPKNYHKIIDRYAYHLDVILSGVFIGNGYAALTVSITSLVVFYAFGFSHILALTTLIFIASLIPMFAGYTVILSLAILRYFDLGLESALIFFAVASIVIYAPPELILRPYLVSLKSHIHPLLLMLAFLGGAFVGGIAGFFAAPILLGALMAAYRVYGEEAQNEKTLIDDNNARDLIE